MPQVPELQQTSSTSLLLIDGTDRQTDGHHVVTETLTDRSDVQRQNIKSVVYRRVVFDLLPSRLFLLLYRLRQPALRLRCPPAALQLRLFQLLQVAPRALRLRSLLGATTPPLRRFTLAPQLLLQATSVRL